MSIPASAHPSAPATDADNWHQPGVTVAATNSGNTTFTTVTSGITVTCTHSSTSGKTALTGLNINIGKLPTFNDGTGVPCTDTTTSTDSIVANKTNGNWKISLQDSGDKTSAVEPNLGDKMSIVIPKAGLIDTITLPGGLGTCVVTIAPAGTARVQGTYDDAGHLAISNAPVPISIADHAGGTCPTDTSAKFTGNYTLSPAVYDNA